MLATTPIRPEMSPVSAVVVAAGAVEAPALSRDRRDASAEAGSGAGRPVAADSSMSRVYDCTADPLASVTVIASSNSPRTAGVPRMSPLDGSSARPVGSAPEANAKRTGPRAPATSMRVS